MENGRCIVLYYTIINDTQEPSEIILVITPARTLKHPRPMEAADSGGLEQILTEVKKESEAGPRKPVH